jgi:hypothetical protein
MIVAVDLINGGCNAMDRILTTVRLLTTVRRLGGCWGASFLTFLLLASTVAAQEVREKNSEKEQIARLIAELDAEQYDVRERSSQSLLKFGPGAVDHRRKQ